MHERVLWCIIEPSTTQLESKMSKFTTKQLQAALIGLRAKSDKDSAAAFEMTFDEVCARMGDDAFDAWCIAQGW